MTHAFMPEQRLLFCPRCACQHEDFGIWATKPHRTHLCMFCKHEWQPFPFTTVGVATPGDDPSLLITLAVFERMREYSCTLPTNPRSGSFWRCRRPYYSLDDHPSTRHYLGLALSMPNDPPERISLFWRDLHVAEWVAGRLLSRYLESA